MAPRRSQGLTRHPGLTHVWVSVTYEADEAIWLGLVPQPGQGVLPLDGGWGPGARVVNGRYEVVTDEWWLRHEGSSLDWGTDPGLPAWEEVGEVRTDGPPHAVGTAAACTPHGARRYEPPHAVDRQSPDSRLAGGSQRSDVPVVAGRTHRAIGGQAGARSPERGPVDRASDRQGPARVGRTSGEVAGPGDWTHVARNVEAMATNAGR
jgi:hypothetical protein